MPIRFSGPLGLRLGGFIALNRIAVATFARHVLGRRLVPSWDMGMEIGVRFWRRQFTRAMTAADSARGRQILDAVQTETPDRYNVTVTAEPNLPGTWYHPARRETEAVILYLHGGGYMFHGAMSRRFAAMLAHRVGAPLFAPKYRLTPEHSHPAQAEDARAAWDLVTRDTDPGRVVVIGDSAGGHMMLMLLLALREVGQPQPKLGVGLCPWTDIGDRGASLTENDPTDLVQGWMALQFGRWLDPHRRFGRDALSPITHDFKGLAPLYLQAGGREVLRDMIYDFACVQDGNGAEVMLDLWPDMPHDFQLMDSTQADAGEALARIRAMVHGAVTGSRPEPCDRTVRLTRVSADVEQG